MENISVKLQHDTEISWRVIIFTRLLDLDLELIKSQKRSHKGQHWTHLRCWYGEHLYKFITWYRQLRKSYHMPRAPDGHCSPVQATTIPLQPKGLMGKNHDGCENILRTIQAMYQRDLISWWMGKCVHNHTGLLTVTNPSIPWWMGKQKLVPNIWFKDLANNFGLKCFQNFCGNRQLPIMIQDELERPRFRSTRTQALGTSGEV